MPYISRYQEPGLGKNTKEADILRKLLVLTWSPGRCHQTHIVKVCKILLGSIKRTVRSSLIPPYQKMNIMQAVDEAINQYQTHRAYYARF